MNTSNKISSKTLKEQAYKILKEKLVNCEFPPGGMLNEAQLSSELGISRTPIREAISVLETEGYLKIVPKKGILVTDILLNDVLQIFQARMEIEPITLKMAGPNLSTEELIKWRDKFMNKSDDVITGFRLDTEMHMYIIEHCNNQYIIEMMKKIFEKNTRIIISSKQNRMHYEDAQKEHIEILNALIERNYDYGAELMRKHINNCRRSALNYFYNL